MGSYNRLLNSVTVGASGSVFGILLAFGMMFPNTLIYIYFLFPIKAKWFVIIYGALELFSGISNLSDGVAHFAHLGGMVFGLILILLWRKRHRNTYEYY
jgi:membrane associated rhomboid family serine protease